MTSMASSIRRTCAFFAVGLARHQQQVSSFSSHRVSSSFFASPSSFATFRLSSTVFQAPEPPQSKGEAVYKDINLSSVDKNDQTKESLARNSDPSAVFVVSGASRGIGLQFVKSLLQRTKGTVVALCRSPESSKGLKDAICVMGEQERNRLIVFKLDLEDQSSIDTACADIKSSFDRVDLLLNVAGILGDGKETPGPERTLLKIDRDWMTKTYDINVVGPVMLSQGLVPLMEQQRRGNEKKDLVGRPISVIVNLSARVGSISDNGLGGWYSYRISKSALNQATRTMSHELKRKSIWSIALHPGTTDTDLSKPFQRNVQEGRLFPVDFTVDSLLGVIDSMQEENSGGLYDWAGKAIPF
jgi:NAD(P)-dependent dehydrogenase (short-subunit alcohol dehydrogenase family)